MRIIDFKTYIEEFPILAAYCNETVIVTSEKTCILHGENAINSIPNVEVYETHGSGGSLVNFKEDVCVGEFSYDEKPTGEEWMDRLVKFLKSKGINAVKQGNDVLAEGLYKVGSYMRYYIDGCWNTACHISVGMDIDIIKKVCTKEMDKIPKGLKDYGITQEDIIKLYNK